MRKSAVRMTGVLCAVMFAVAACGGDNDSGAGSAGGTVKVGLLTTLSGPASAGFVGAKPGVEARLQAYKAEGGKCSGLQFDLVTADDQSSPQGALAGAQKLVQQDKAYAVLEVSPYFFGAAKYMTTSAKGTPAIGGAFDSAPQWLETDSNLFAAVQKVPDFANTYTTMGDYWKAMGITKVAAVSYDNKASQEGMNQALRSSDAAGIGRAYVNDTLAIGSADVGAIVLGIKNSGAEALYLPINPDTSLAIVGGLRQAGVNLKSIVSVTGYGADLLASPPAVQAAQGMTFVSQTAPSEMNTPATQKFADALKQYAGSPSGVPTFSQTYGWLAADLMIYGLEAAGCDASQAKFTSALRGDRSWDASGLLAAPADFATLNSEKDCVYLVDLKGDGFVPVPNGTPLCGTRL
ncbi:ABC transporter substrate-binding protein [Nocardia bovistercoris]|uniref:ABC transporter substrate-binding protein n=1 Tax=Nocardia bovistercoris TaxID=2785916 RepID=A0A931IHL3_9NOCA|nr:ABC transporter substrate-binding protein [Nocardia bovistercoris]MBH0779778.1 ABC transporter substrate-binding protein [Nocardia bovistercoris]